MKIATTRGIPSERKARPLIWLKMLDFLVVQYFLVPNTGEGMFAILLLAAVAIALPKLTTTTLSPLC